MKPNCFDWFEFLRSLSKVGILMVLVCAAVMARADQIQMQNGDRYVGKLLSVNGESLLLQSDVLGQVRVPRAKVAWVAFGSSSPTNEPVAFTSSNALVGAVTNATPVKSDLARLGISSNLIHQIESQYLSDASPESKDMFNQLLGGLMSGKLDVQDIRAQAKSTASQVRAMKKDLGDEAGFMLDTYLAILDHFVNETTPSGGAVPKSAPVPKPHQPGATGEAD